MTASAQTHPARPWIAASESFAAQPGVLAGLPAELVDAIAAVPERPSRALLLGIGASHAAAASGAYRMRSTGIDASRHLPSELAGVTAADLVIATSQSGRSAEVVEAARGLSHQSVLAITNYRPSPLGDLAEHVLNLGDHPDSSVSFVSFTSTLIAFGMLADHWNGDLDRSRWDALVASVLESAEAADASLRDAADVIAPLPFTDFIAPAPIMSAAEEAALMFREGPLVAATAMETRLYLHGPMDVAGPGAHVVMGGAREALLVDQLSELTSAVVFLRTDATIPMPAAAATCLDVTVADDDPIGQAVAATLMAQRLALEVAGRRGVDIDRPVFTRLDTKTASAAR